MMNQPKITSRTDDWLNFEFKIPLCLPMLEAEEELQRCLNMVGTMASAELLQKFDTDGSIIEVGHVKFYPHGEQEEKEFQTPYGATTVKRYVYQTSEGGERYVPMDQGARIIGTSTPKFAKMVSSKYACDGAPGVQRDLAENHNRPVALSFIKSISDLVGTIAIEKEKCWTYSLPTLDNKVESISVGLDGTCLNMKDDGWREAMCGTITLHDKQGERLHTIYTSAAPQYGKEAFLDKFASEVAKTVNLFPKKTVVGLADGAASNWKFLEERCDMLTVDFWHLTEYLALAAEAMFPGKRRAQDREQWLTTACHKAKHTFGGVSRILTELVAYSKRKKLSCKIRKDLQRVITYLTNHKSKMQYHTNQAQNLPIGSGVTEAACKAIVKNRMCKGAARWKDLGASTVLTIRSLYMTKGRWDQFWSKYSQYGCKVA